MKEQAKSMGKTKIYTGVRITSAIQKYWWGFIRTAVQFTYLYTALTKIGVPH